jgi:nucleoside-diphosphate-sugar epimerase
MADIGKVLITGGSGKAGRWVIAEFQQQGYEVINCDTRPSDQVHTLRADLTDLGQVFGVLEGKSAVVHLAAIPWPGEHPPEVVFRNNVLSTFNVLQAATVLGVRRIVLAGSESSLGFPFAFRPITPRYLPIDEEHPLLAQDAYGLGKMTGELLADGFARRDPELRIVTLRFSYIIPPDDYPNELRMAWSSPAQNSFNLWGYIDARDVGVACRLAVECGPRGHTPLYIAAPDTLMREPTLDLVRQVFPDVGPAKPGFGGCMSPLDGARAAAVLGFRPAYTWGQRVTPEEAT